MPDWQVEVLLGLCLGDSLMPFGGHLPEICARNRWRWRAVLAAGSAVTAIWLAGCSGSLNSSDLFPNSSSRPAAVAMAPTAAPAPAPALGAGGVKVGLILPMSASGNAGMAGQAMRNAAELALAEFSEPNI